MIFKADMYVKSEKELGKKFTIVAFGLLMLVIVFSTYLHHFQPHVLKVPSVTDVSTWRNPSFEQTNIYERMTDAEIEKMRADGIPGRGLLPVIFDSQGDLTAFLFASLCFLHARRHFGQWMASCFLIGSFIFTGLQESIAILLGRFTAGAAYVDAAQHVTYGTYFFCKGSLWFIETPVAVCLSWFWIAYACVWIARKVFPKMSLLARAAIGGLIALNIDLWLDPVATSPEFMQWVWARGDQIRILGINHSNFVGWFILIFWFAIIWEWLPRLADRMGRFKASFAFITIILVSDMGMLIYLILHNTIIVAGLLSLLGKSDIYFPQGW
ncbi:MAG: carotenoid biosynthesis protein [Deltaproteobacteria bacterium]|nr:carotenoid biosynthesis protein [Deltaproteobacteria bacterium]